MRHGRYYEALFRFVSEPGGIVGVKRVTTSRRGCGILLSPRLVVADAADVEGSGSRAGVGGGSNERDDGEGSK